MERWDTPDGDFVEVARLNGASASSPRIIVFHGLEGSLRSHYVRGIFKEAAARGWGADLLFFRTCGSEPNRIARSYHSGETEDARFVIARIAAQFPQAAIGLFGVSLGGNVLCKYLGEEGTRVLPAIAGATAVSVPYDLARASRYIGRGFGAVYERNFLRSLVPKALEKIARHPELSALKQVANAKTIWEFDDLFTAPLHGFLSAEDYYNRSSSMAFLHQIRSPLLMLSAADDPFLPPEVLDEVREVASKNSWLSVEFHRRGGHVGFVSGRWPWSPWYYAEWRAAAFLATCFDKHDGSVAK